MKKTLIAVFFLPPFCFADNHSPESCSQIENNSQRLACYDNLFSTTQETKPARDETAQEPPQQSRGIVPETFGLKKRINQKELPQIAATIQSFSKLNNDRISINLDNGQTWRSTESIGRLRLKKSTKVTITKSRIGGFKLKAEGQKGFVRIKRVK